MRVLVVGTVPPAGGEAARRLVSATFRKIEEGDRIEVVSPDSRSAAHHIANLASWRLALRLFLFGRRFDALVLRIEPGLPFFERASRFERAAVLWALGLALHRYSEVSIYLDSPIPLPGGVGGRAARGLWSAATSISVEDEHDRERVLAAPGVDSSRVHLAPKMSSPSKEPARAWPSATDDYLRERALGRIRQRAAAERLANSARADLGEQGLGPVALDVFPEPSNSTRRRGDWARNRYVVGAIGHRAVRVLRSLWAFDRSPV